MSSCSLVCLLVYSYLLVPLTQSWYIPVIQKIIHLVQICRVYRSIINISFEKYQKHNREKHQESTYRYKFISFIQSQPVPQIITFVANSLLMTFIFISIHSNTNAHINNCLCLAKKSFPITKLQKYSS